MAWGKWGEVSPTLINTGDEKKRKRENKGKGQKERKKTRKWMEEKSKRGEMGHFGKKTDSEHEGGETMRARERK